jgi:hypothetical protein
MYYLTVVTCIKQEDDYIDDFIKIHEKLGVESFIFYDRDGDNLTNKFKDKKNVTVVKYPEPNRHHHSHAYTVKNFQGHSKWMAFIDCDQVLFSPTNTDLKITMQQYEKFAQMQPVWETFGDSWLEKKEPGSVYTRFTKRAKSESGINNHTQSICDISKMQPIVPPDPHRLIPKIGEISVDENCIKIGDHNGTISLHEKHTQNKIFVAHYILKSKEEFTIKNNKLRADTGTRMDPELFYIQQKYCNEVDDFRIKDFWNLG